MYTYSIVSISKKLLILGFTLCFVKVEPYSVNFIRLSFKSKQDQGFSKSKLSVSLDEWAEGRADWVKKEAKVERPSPPPNFDPTQFDIFNDSKGWSQNINNPYVAAKVAAEYRLLKDKEKTDGNGIDEGESDEDDDYASKSPHLNKNPNTAKWGEVVSYQSKTDDLENPWT